MKIPLHLDLPCLSPGTASSAEQEGRDTTNVPPPLLELTPTGELVLVELQGSLEITGGGGGGSADAIEGDGVRGDGGAGRAGEVLGKFVFEDGRLDRPTLLISHHRLEGKFVSLQNPLAVLRKVTAASAASAATAAQVDDEEGDGRQHKKPKVDDDDGAGASTRYDIVTIVRRKLLFSKRPEPVVRIEDR
ncbi:uncharacterized protein PFL1_01313 [Pseudozyma flocculosa PF-1]|uniref:Chromosome transmission fidelity protein 8 n=1 Tax=Pseudozyma flocculosa TaxID=84751 RepID=A0A5C3EUM6_9BASI|nr:uncharacterized protein PFL1_01313 [Pseudozyma flocculosa PF-1]EPQ31124.1 hypothetical protein PFL1_01313 [Pseudozyma flocculosa PF-1]SPO35988.1 uncharacterized protein PSFLO_01459 [Pseudozyma flocculosa]